MEPSTALMAVAGLLLAFTVSMSVDRFNRRVDLVMAEANAIGTTELRARFLPEPARTQSLALFRPYLDRRIAWGDAGSGAELQRNQQETLQLRDRLWNVAATVAATSPTPPFALYESSLNEMFDLAEERMHVRANRIPEAVLFLVAIASILANGLFAALLGLNGKSGRADLHVLTFVTWMVVLLIVDLDFPRRGLVQVSYEPLIQLQNEWRNAAAPPPAR